MAKIILNKDYGGFDVSPRGYKLYAEKLGRELFYYLGKIVNEDRIDIVYKKVSFEEFLKSYSLIYRYSFTDLGDEIRDYVCKDEAEVLDLDEDHREDPILIEVVEELGNEASTRHSLLKVVEIPDCLIGNYQIDNYDGFETLHEKVVEY